MLVQEGWTTSTTQFKQTHNMKDGMSKPGHNSSNYNYAKFILCTLEPISMDCSCPSRAEFMLPDSCSMLLSCYSL